MEESGKDSSIVRCCSWQVFSVAESALIVMCCSMFCRARSGLILIHPVDLLAQRLGFRLSFLVYSSSTITVF